MKLAAIFAVGMSLSAACDAGDPADDGDAPASAPLVEATAWTMADPAEDVFAELRPNAVDCDPDRGVFTEATPTETRLEINTGWCNYATVVQPLRQSLDEGDTVEVRVYHFELTGGPAQAYIAVALQGEVRWEQVVPIPSEGELLKGTFEIGAAIEAGVPIQFHVNNHGVNTWELVSIDRL